MSCVREVIAIFCVLFVVTNSYTFDYVSDGFYRRCKKCDDDCIKKSAQSIYDKLVHGIPSMGIQCVEPLRRKEISGEVQKLHYNITDSMVMGFSHCDVNKIKVDFYDTCFKMELVCHNMMLMGKYFLDGFILDEKVYEKGHYKLFCPKYKMGIDTKFVEVKDNGKLHMRLKESSMTTFSNAEEKLSVELDNCKGDKDLEDFLNKNWAHIAQLLQGAFADENLKLLVDSANKLLEHISIDDLFIQ